MVPGPAGVSSALFYNPGVRGGGSRETVHAAPARVGGPIRRRAPKARGRAKSRGQARSRIRGSSLPAAPQLPTSPGRGGLRDAAVWRAGLRNKPAASGGAEPPLSAPAPRRPIGEARCPRRRRPGRALGSAPSGLANFAAPAARRAAPRAHVRAGGGEGGPGAEPPAGRGRSRAALPSAAPWPELRARRAESPAGSPGSGRAAPPGRTGPAAPAPGPRRLRSLRRRRPPPPPPPLAEPAALRFPGSASGEPLLPAPSRSCGGRVSRGRARRGRRRRRGEGGRALPRGRDWRQRARGEGAAAAPSQAGSEPRRSPAARPPRGTRCAPAPARK
ncbi:atherin-like [Canis lupus familiaris]|uniref:atherin-like n=1 Tax=Canis lupus familiaris TaxID=9615 RepID=UPI0018F4F46C|nr:atherin-like [Canis lupus familiaris]